MIEVDYYFNKIKELKERALKEQIYNPQNVKNYKCCPYCSCTHFIKHGKYQGIQRYRCKNDECGRTFSSTTFSVWKYLKHKPEKWISFIECMCENMTLETCARVVGITTTTAFNWRHKIFHAVENYYRPKSFKESVTVNDYAVPKCYKGSRNKHFTYKEKIENKTAKLYGYIPYDVEILISAEDEGRPLISVKDDDDESLIDIFETDVLNNLEKECYVHLENVERSRLEKLTMEYNKSLPKYVIKKYGFKIYKNWVGIPHIQDNFKVCSSMNNFVSGLSCWMWHFKGIATKYIKHYYSFYSLVNSVRSYNYIKIFKELLKDGVYTSVETLKVMHLENY